MKTRLIIVASTLLFAGPALAQEPLDRAGTEPSTQAATPSSPAATEPLGQAAADAGKQAAVPAGELVIGELRETRDDNKMVGPLRATVDQVEEMDIFDASGKKIAEVESVLEDKNGEMKGVAIEYGGFLGIGGTDAILTFDKMRQKDGNIVVEMTEDDLVNLPAWHQ